MTIPAYDRPPPTWTTPRCPECPGRVWTGAGEQPNHNSEHVYIDHSFADKLYPVYAPDLGRYELAVPAMDGDAYEVEDDNDIDGLEMLDRRRPCDGQEEGADGPRS